jgi:hypothetical protein
MIREEKFQILSASINLWLWHFLVHLCAASEGLTLERHDDHDSSSKQERPSFLLPTTNNVFQAESVSLTRDVANVEAVKQTVTEELIAAAPVAVVAEHKKHLLLPETLVAKKIKDLLCLGVLGDSCCGRSVLFLLSSWNGDSSAPILARSNCLFDSEEASLPSTALMSPFTFCGTQHAVSTSSPTPAQQSHTVWTMQAETSHAPAG